MQFPILCRWTGAVKFTAEIDCPMDAPPSLKIGLAVKWALKERADLSDADLSDADLSDANLSDANLSDADLSDANLSDANLSDADLSRANLSRANLSRANLSRANLSRANLSRANLSDIRNDLWDVLIRSRHEVPGLLEALRAGRVNGSTYSGECACLVGTISNIRRADYRYLGNGLAPNAGRPAERWFLGIQEGETPETSPIAKITEGWIAEFLALMSDVPTEAPRAAWPALSRRFAAHCRRSAP